jgi:hypothetical protein
MSVVDLLDDVVGDHLIGLDRHDAVAVEIVAELS